MNLVNPESIPVTRQPGETVTGLSIRAIRHQAWAEGEAAGFSRAMRKMSDEPLVERAPNPYADPSPETGASA